MSDPRELPYLIRLLDDETPEVRESVVARLASFGSSLNEELRRQGLELTDHEVSLVHREIQRLSRQWLLQQWPAWIGMEDEKEKLEMALSLIAEFQDNRVRPGHLHTLLDALAREYVSRHRTAGLRELSRFLFGTKKLTGAEQDYYDPRNSSLVYVIEQRRGIPISLACVFMLVGHRLGLQIEGCNFPGHFLAMAYENQKPIIVDCFHGGLFLDDSILSRQREPITVTVQKLTALRSDSFTIVERVVRNLVNAYSTVGRPDEKDLMLRLLDVMRGRGEE